MEGFLNPKKVLREIRLRRNMIAVDFGCGSGGWVIPLAKELEEGRVLAVDILQEPLSALKAKAKLERVSNVEIVSADIEKGTELFDNSADLVLMTNLLFQCQDRKRVLEEGKRILKKGGKILVVDWEIDSPLGPKEGRVSSEEIKKISQSLGLKLKREFKASNYHYGLIFER